MTCYSCSKDRLDVAGELSDKKYFEAITDSKVNYYYKSDSLSFLSPKGNSPHGIFKVRFNKTAQSALDASGALPVGALFPDSSLIVKDAYTSAGGTLQLYAAMYKINGSWRWAEYAPDGTVIYSVYKDPSTCINCHKATSNRDYTLLFNLH